jgi:hypothetical protein
MSFTASQVEEIVNELLELKKTLSIDEINCMEKFNDFKSKNQLFFNTILSDQMDPVIFKQMMAMKRRLESGEDQYSVDVRFGEFMSKKYIEPVLKNNSKK